MLFIELEPISDYPSHLTTVYTPPSNPDLPEVIALPTASENLPVTSADQLADDVISRTLFENPSPFPSVYFDLSFSVCLLIYLRSICHLLQGYVD